VADRAASCHHLHTRTRIIAGLFDTSDNRSKFNVALGIESQGFCLLKG
jgi:hypothetical protein